MAPHSTTLLYKISNLDMAEWPLLVVHALRPLFVADPGQVGNGVPDGDIPSGGAATPTLAVRVVRLAVKTNASVVAAGRAVLRQRVGGQPLAGCCRQDDQTLPALGHTVVTRLGHNKVWVKIILFGTIQYRYTIFVLFIYLQYRVTGYWQGRYGLQCSGKQKISGTGI